MTNSAAVLEHIEPKCHSYRNSFLFCVSFGFTHRFSLRKTDFRVFVQNPKNHRSQTTACEISLIGTVSLFRRVCAAGAAAEDLSVRFGRLFGAHI